MSGCDTAMMFFISFSASIAGSLVKSNRLSDVQAFVLMLCANGASDRQPCESNVAPNGAAPESMTALALARYSSQVAGAASGSFAVVVRPECQPVPITSSRNGQPYILPLI